MHCGKKVLQLQICGVYGVSRLHSWCKLLVPKDVIKTFSQRIVFVLACMVETWKKTVKGFAFVSSHSEHSQDWGTFPSSMCSKHLKGKPLAKQTETTANSQKKQWNYEGSRREEVWEGNIWWNKGFEKLLCYTEESWSHAHDHGWMHVQKRPEKSPFFISG